MFPTSRRWGAADLDEGVVEIRSIAAVRHAIGREGIDRQARGRVRCPPARGRRDHTSGDTIADPRDESDRRAIVQSVDVVAVDAMQPVFKGVIDTWVARAPRNKELLALVQAEIANVRSGK